MFELSVQKCYISNSLLTLNMIFSKTFFSPLDLSFGKTVTPFHLKLRMRLENSKIKKTGAGIFQILSFRGFTGEKLPKYVIFLKKYQFFDQKMHFSQEQKKIPVLNSRNKFLSIRVYNNHTKLVEILPCGFTKQDEFSNGMLKLLPRI